MATHLLMNIIAELELKQVPSRTISQHIEFVDYSLNALWLQFTIASVIGIVCVVTVLSGLLLLFLQYRKLIQSKKNVDVKRVSQHYTAHPKTVKAKRTRPAFKFPHAVPATDNESSEISSRTEL